CLLGEAGSPTVSVSVTNSDGTNSGNATQVVTITDVTPTVSLSVGNATAVTESGSAQTYLYTISDPGPADIVSSVSASCGLAGVLSNSSHTNGGGSFDCTFAEEGSSTVSVSETNSDGLTSSTASQSVSISDPAASPTGSFTVTAVEGANSSSQTVATFTDPGGAEALADYSASIDWGDSSASPGTITFSGGTFTVGGAHTYAEEGGYEITVTLGHDSALSATATSSAKVADAALTAGALSLSAGTEGVSPVTASFNFSDANPSAPASDFSAIITWGDGRSSPGAVSGSSGSFTVAGSHVYAEEGTTAAVSVPVSDDGGSTTSSPISTAGVADATLTATNGKGLIATEGSWTGTVTVATFADANAFATAADFGGTTIDWGDGTPASVGTITLSAGVFTVSGSHTYVEEGSYTATAHISDEGGSSTTGTDAATVNDAALTATKGKGLTSIEGGSTG